MTRPRQQLRVETLEDRTVPAYGFDPAFGGTGRVAEWLDYASYTPDVEVQADGGILVTAVPLDSPASSQLRAELIRFNPDGTRDATFGAGERAFFDQDVFGTRIAVAPDGDIYVGADTSDMLDAVNASTDVTVYRFNADGSRDTAFGVGGKVTFNFGDVPGAVLSRFSELVVQADGKLVVVGNVSGVSDSSSNISAARFNTDGSPDATFDGNGLLQFAIGSFEDARAMDVAIDSNGKILVGAVAFNDLAFGVPRYAAVVRLNADGSADTSFDLDGVWIGRTGTVAYEVLPLAGGKLLVAGTAGSNTSVIRLDSTGAADATFGAGDWTAVNRVGPFGSVSAALLPDGRIAVVSSFNDLFFPTAVAIVSADGVPSDSLVGGGVFGIHYGNYDPELFSTPKNARVAVGPDGRIVVAAGLYDGEVPGPNYGLSRNSVGIALLADVPDALPGMTLDIPPVFPPLQNTPPEVPIIPEPPNDDHLLLPPTSTTVRAAATELAEQGRVALADVNGDGTPDTITVTAPGTPIRVTVVSGADGTTVLIPAFDPFGGNFTGGGFVVAADLDGDGYAEFVVTPDQGGGPRVAVFSMVQFSGQSFPESLERVWTRANFFGIDDLSFRGGVRVALGDVNGDGTPDLAVSAGFLGGPRVAVFDGKTVLTTPTRLASDFFVFTGSDAQTLRNGAFVALGDLDGDGRAELIASGGPGGAPRVLILSGAKLGVGDVAGAQASPVANFFVAGNTTDRGGVRVSTQDTNGDRRADVTVNTGERLVRTYLGQHFTGGGEPALFYDTDLAVSTID